MGQSKSAWYVYQNNEQLGPLTFDDLAQKISQKQLQPEAYAYTEGFKDWTPIQNVPELAPFINAGDTANASIPISSEPSSGQHSSPDPEPESKWSVNKDGKTIGAFDIREIQNKLREGSLSKEDYVWKEGWSDWVPIEDSSDLKDTVQELNRTTIPMGQPAQETGSHKTNRIEEKTPAETRRPRRSRAMTEDSIEMGFSKPKKKRRFTGLLFLLIFGGSGYYVFKHPQIIPPQVMSVIPADMLTKFLSKFQRAPKNPGPSTPPMPSGTEPGHGAGANAPGRPTNIPSLMPMLQAVPGSAGFSDQLFSDIAVVALKTPPTGMFHFVAYSQQQTIFVTSTFIAHGPVTMSPTLTQSGLTTLLLFSQKDNGAIDPLAERVVNVFPATGATTLQPLPQRVEQLGKWFRAMTDSVNKMQSDRRRATLWQKTGVDLLKNHMALKSMVQNCLGTIHLPTSCADLAQYWKDGMDLHRTVTLVHQGATLAKIDSAVGRSDKQIYLSIKNLEKVLGSFIEAPKAVEQVDRKDILRWLQNSNVTP